MRTTADYLDLLRQHFSATTDGQLIAHTGWRRQVISRYRTKTSTFDDDTAERVAGWLNLPLADVLIDMNAQRAKKESVKKAWLSVAAAAVVAAVAVQFALMGERADYWTISALASAAAVDPLYIMRIFALAILALLVCHLARTQERAQGKNNDLLGRG